MLPVIFDSSSSCKQYSLDLYSLGSYPVFTRRLTNTMSSKSPSTVENSPAFTTPQRLQKFTPRSRSRSGGTPFRLSRTNTPSSARRTPADRFIPNRASMDVEFSTYKVNSAAGTPVPQSRAASQGSENGGAMREKLLSLKGCSSKTRVLSFKQTAATCSSTGKTTEKYQYWSPYTSSLSSSAKRKARKIPKSAEKVLDAPNLLNDFYLNVLDWSRRGHLAIALAGSVYTLDTDGKGSISNLCNTEDDSIYVSSLQWNKAGKYLAIGTSDAEVQLWDVNAYRLVRRLKTHEARVGTLAWNNRTGLLSCGSQSGQIHNYDPRMAHFHVHTLKGHTSGLEVCGLKWSPNGRFLASGSNDNTVNVWDTYTRDPWATPANSFKEHTAAVKALAWCPWQPSLLATGGGSADKHIRLWNASTGSMEADVETGSQVSGLLWSSNHRELISSHGHSKNHLTIWRCGPSSLSHLTNLIGHEERILHIAMSPDGQTVASAAADETLRLWKCFSTDPNKTKENDLPLSELNVSRYIR